MQYYVEGITAELKVFNWEAVEYFCYNLIQTLYSSEDHFDTKNAEQIIKLLRSKRLFHLMQQVGDAIIQTGQHTYKIKRQYAQALIDQNNFTAALSILKDLVAETEYDSGCDRDVRNENAEARGLIGRVYKQLYVNAKSPFSIHSANYLKESIKYYLDVYVSEPHVRTWHGINVVALLKRAHADNLQLIGFPAADEIAQSVLLTLQNRYDNQKADAWDFATAAEACIALDKPEEALEWMSGYARMPYCDAFELASTLRQLEEVWCLNLDTESGRLLLPLLRAELLKREGGNVTLDAGELKKMIAAEVDITQRYSTLVKENNTQSGIKLESVFGFDSFKTYKWYMTGAARCKGVVRIGRDSSFGFGTGFLLNGSNCNESFGEELLVLTNAHVLSNNPAHSFLTPDKAVIIFEALNRDEEFKIQEIIWSSPPEELDATIVRFKKEDESRLKALTKDINAYPLSISLPQIQEPPSERVYIIGHPNGGTLQLSLQDNILLDHENPKLHYRTPTEYGSSGSPVFNDQWELIGLHHGSNERMERLNNKSGFYEANEGIWIRAILKKFCHDLSGYKIDSDNVEEEDTIIMPPQ